MNKNLLLIPFLIITLSFVSFGQYESKKITGKFKKPEFNKLKKLPNGIKSQKTKLYGLKSNGDSDPCTAVTLSGASLTGTCITGDNTGASGNFVSSFGCGNNQMSEIFFKFIATQKSLDITVNDLTMGGANPEVTIWKDSLNNCASGDWWVIHTTCPAFGTTTSWINTFDIGEEYYISIDSDKDNEAGSFQLCVDNYLYSAPAGSGGDCASAIPVSLPFSHNGNTLSTQLNNWSNSCYFGDGFDGYDTWYKYTSPGDEYISVSLTNITPQSMGFPATVSGFPVLAENYYAVVNVLDGNNCTLGTSASECLYGGDPTISTDQNSYATGYDEIYIALGVDNSTPLICKTFYIENAGDYLFMVEGYQIIYIDGLAIITTGWYSINDGQLNSYTLNINSMAQGPNDDCGNPDSLLLNIPQSGNNSGCNYSWNDTEDPESWQMCANSTENTAWFSFTTGATDTDVDIEFQNVIGDVQWGVVQGSCGGPYSSLGTNASNPGAGIQAAGTNGGIGLSSAGDPCWRDDTDHTINISGLSPNTQYWIVVDGNAGTFSSFDVVITGGITVGLDFLNVKGRQEKFENIIEWSSENNSATSHFEILRSTNKISFDVISSIDASEFDLSHYSFVDNNIKLGLTYYYLIKKINNNETETASKIIKIETSTNINNLSNVYLKGNNLLFNLNLIQNSDVEISIYDMNAKLIQSKVLTKDKGLNTLNIKTKLSNGTYILYIKSNNEVLYQKFVK